MRQRGTVYLLVLSVTAMLVAIGVTAVMVGRVDVKADRLEADQTRATVLAQSAIEVIRYCLEVDSGWRGTHTSGVWSGYEAIDAGQYRYKLVDEADGDLDDEASDPARVYVEVQAGQATRVYSVVLRDGKRVTSQFPTVTEKDDAGESGALGVCVTNLGYLQIGDNGSVNAIAGLRFDHLPIEQGRVVHAASLQFTSDEANATPTTLTIWAQADDDAPDFSSSGFNISSRPKTAVGVAWSPDAWSTGDRGEAQATPDLAAVVQEVVRRPGWQNDRAIVFILEGTQARNVRTYDYSAADAPVLHLTYTAPGLTADYTTLRRELAP